MYTLGVDIGSTTSKAVVLKDGQEIIASSIVVATVGTKDVETAVTQALENAGVTRADITETTPSTHTSTTL